MSGSERKETVTVSFISNHEVDPDEFDLRVRKPEKIREQLLSAARPRGMLQEPVGKDDPSLRRYREEIKEARERNNQSPDTDTDRSEADAP